MGRTSGLRTSRSVSSRPARRQLQTGCLRQGLDSNDVELVRAWEHAQMTFAGYEVSSHMHTLTCFAIFPL